MSGQLQPVGCRLPSVREQWAASCPCRPARAFTLVELLVVISILGLIAGIAVPALKDLGKANTQISAARQLLDDVGRARQLAMSQHTTVYMVFVPTNFILLNNVNGQAFWTGLNSIVQNDRRILAQTVASNLLAQQLTGYALISLRSMGDQPGQNSTNYLTEWQALPQGAFISPYKFLPYADPALPLQISQWRQDHPDPDGNFIYQFQSSSFPFPTIDSPPVYLPCIAFNYLGQLVQTLPSGSSLWPPNPQRVADAYIPLVQGIVGYGVDPATKQPTATIVNPGDIIERPPGNSTGIGYNIVHVDALTGRATLEFFKVK